MAVAHRRYHPVGRDRSRPPGVAGLRLAGPAGCVGVRRQCGSRAPGCECGCGWASSPHGSRAGSRASGLLATRRWARTSSGKAAHCPGWSRRCARQGGTKSQFRQPAAGRASPRTSSASDVSYWLYYYITSQIGDLSVAWQTNRRETAFLHVSAIASLSQRPLQPERMAMGAIRFPLRVARTAQRSFVIKITNECRLGG
jgi:hypothetical protein